jgi:acetoacetyl-CoA synthase
MNDPLWCPSQVQIETANVTRFIQSLQQTGVPVQGWDGLYQWSLEHPREFWRAVWEFTDIVGDLDENTILVEHPQFTQNIFFKNSTLNYAENLLHHQGPEPALIFYGEDQVRRELSFDELRAQVAQVAARLKELGIKQGDRVAAYMPNMPETLIAMLATVSLGAIWSSCSPDFGVQGVVDRFAQIEPKILFVTDGYYFKGKTIDVRAKVTELLNHLPSVQKVINCPYVQLAYDDPAIESFNSLKGEEEVPLTFTRVPFNHPLFIMFSSGTTGIPKCIVHGHGGTLIQHLKEHQLHADIKPGDRLFYYTTVGWMMWNWLVTGLASRATLILYDGSPFVQDGAILYDIAQREQVTFFGVSAKYLDACAKAGIAPIQTHNLRCMRTIGSTGSPLVPESFDYVYKKIASHVNLASLSGGTDIISCFALGCPVKPVWRGELQSRGLGMAVEVFNDAGQSLRGQKGELVCTQPFPSMPVGFWNDLEGTKYQAAYFERFPNIWTHGDYVELTPQEGLIIYGRSDALLNPGGVRIGTAEIYRQVEHFPEICESIAVGQSWQGDTRIILFVKMVEGHRLDHDLIRRLKSHISSNASPRHIPALILEIPDIPRTLSGKIVELAVTDVIHGRAVKNKEALANPEALDYFKNRPELQQG